MQHTNFGRIALLAGLVWPAILAAQQPGGVKQAEFVSTTSRVRLFGSSLPKLAPVPIDGIPQQLRDSIVKVIQQPTLSAHGTAEEFAAGPYDWLLDHPDRVAVAWRRLGVPCVTIANKGDGRFGYADALGSDITWLTAAKSPGLRIWYAEGQAKPNSVLPLMPIRAVAVLHHSRRTDEAGQTFVTHDVDVYLQTDSKAAAIAARLLGPAAPRMAEQGASQLLMFFSQMSKHLDEHPEQAPNLMRR